jgi:hypothetical protein
MNEGLAELYRAYGDRSRGSRRIVRLSRRVDYLAKKMETTEGKERDLFTMEYRALKWAVDLADKIGEMMGEEIEEQKRGV